MEDQYDKAIQAMRHIREEFFILESKSLYDNTSKDEELPNFAQEAIKRHRTVLAELYGHAS